MQRDDLVLKFGGLRHPQSNLQALAAVVAENENVGSRLASRHLKWSPDGVFDVFTEASRCARTADRDRRPHRFEADTEAGLGRARFIRVCFMFCTARMGSYSYPSCHLVPYAPS